MVTAIGEPEEEETTEEGEEDALDELCRDEGAEEELEGDEAEAESDGEGEVEREDELCRELGPEPAAG
ncbi:hypothetical protein [Catenulispora rubra]|uniref:hypothetical protein n=1 Tax=Catenulispora rubra TaxID=280293 RepID=UPI001E381307|nr:hypothetical protein [Catenulispora rubra]